MGEVAESWVIGWLVCPKCGYEWDASVERSDMFRAGEMLADIVTGKRKFGVQCPQCLVLTTLHELAGE